MCCFYFFLSAPSNVVREIIFNNLLQLYLKSQVIRGMDLLNSEIDLGTVIIWNNNLNSSNNCTTDECLQSYSQMNNQSMSTSSSDTINSFFPSVFFQIIIYTLYTLIFILALVGNLVVVAVVFASIRKWTVRISDNNVNFYFFKNLQINLT